MSESQGAAEWLRDKVRNLRNTDDFTCKNFMSYGFGVSCGGKRCADCYADMLECIADRIDAERAIPEGIEWPRFEDGELVKPGDEVGIGEPFVAREIAFESERWLIKASSHSAFGCFHGKYGELTKRPKPKVLDADGAPIEVGDTVYFVGGSGTRFAVKDIDFKPDGAFVDIIDEDRYSATVNPESLTHERPDSWERLEEDAYHLVMSEYLETPEKDVSDLVRRAKALAKAGE